MSPRFTLRIRLRAAGTGLAVLALIAAGCSKQERQEAEPSTPPPTPASSAPAPATVFTPVSPVSPEVDKIINQARAAIGPEDKLNAINAILFTGSVLDEKGQPFATIQIVYQKPGKMRSVVQSPQVTATEGSDGMVGWTLNVDKDNTKKFSFLPTDTERLNFDTALENLYFYRGAELVPGSKVTDEGEVQYRGANCHKVSFQYPDGVTFIRYFDTATGKLHGTVILPSGGELVEEGSQNVNGITFPVVVRDYDKDGKLVQTVKFDHVYLNPRIASDVFSLPDIKMLMASPAQPASAAGSGTAKPATSAPAGTSINLPSPQQLFQQR